MLLDANAAPGAFDKVCVCRHDLPSSPNTPFFRQSLAEGHLCLQCTHDLLQGYITSWVTPVGSSEQYIGYIIRLALYSIDAASLEELRNYIDLGHAAWDRTAIRLELTWTEHRTTRTQTSSRGSAGGP